MAGLRSGHVSQSRAAVNASRQHLDATTAIVQLTSFDSRTNFETAVIWAEIDPDTGLHTSYSPAMQPAERQLTNGCASLARRLNGPMAVGPRRSQLSGD